MKCRSCTVLSQWPALVLLVGLLAGLTFASIRYYRDRLVTGMNEPVVAAFYNQRLHPRIMGYVTPAQILFHEYIDDGKRIVEWEGEWILRPPGSSPVRIGIVDESRREYGLWFQSLRTDTWTPRFYDRSARSHFSPTPFELQNFEAAFQRDPRLAGRPRHATMLNPEVGLDLLGIAFVLLSVLSAWLNVRRWRRPQRSTACSSCGYDLTGLPAPVCPECGTPMNSASHP